MILRNFFLIFLTLALPIQAGYYAMITDLGISAQSIGLGNTHGYSDSSEAVFSNPATLKYSKGSSFSLFSAEVMSDIDYLQLSLSTQTDFGSIGVGVYQQKVTNIPATYEYLEATIGMKKIVQVGSYDYKNSMYKISYQHPLGNNGSFGLSYNHYNVTIDSYTGRGNNIDIGFLAPLYQSTISLYAQNIIPNRQVYYSNNSAETLPTIISLTHIIPVKDLTFIPQLSHQRSQLLFSTGLAYKPSFIPYFQLLCGYKQQLDYTAKKHQKFTFGFGLTLFLLDVYYAYERSDYYLKDHTSYISLNYQL